MRAIFPGYVTLIGSGWISKSSITARRVQPYPYHSAFTGMSVPPSPTSAPKPAHQEKIRQTLLHSPFSTMSDQAYERLAGPAGSRPPSSLHTLLHTPIPSSETHPHLMCIDGPLGRAFSKGSIVPIYIAHDDKPGSPWVIAPASRW